MKKKIRILLVTLIGAVLFSCGRSSLPPEQPTDSMAAGQSAESEAAETAESSNGGSAASEPIPTGDCVRILGLALDASHPYYHSADTEDGSVGSVDANPEGASAAWDAENHILTLNGLTLSSSSDSSPAILFEAAGTIRLKGSENLIRSTGGKPCISSDHALSIAGDGTEQSALTLESGKTAPALELKGGFLELSRCTLAAFAEKSASRFVYGVKVSGDTGNSDKAGEAGRTVGAAVSLNEASLTGNGLALSADSGGVSMTVSGSTADVCSLLAEGQDSVLAEIKNGSRVSCSYEDLDVPCALGVYGASDPEEKVTLLIDGSEVYARNGSEYGMCITAESAWDVYSSENDRGGSCEISIVNGSTVSADNTGANNTDSHRTGAIFLLSCGGSVLNIDGSQVTAIGGNNHLTYGISSQVVRSGEGDSVVNIAGGSRVETSGYCGLDLRVWGSNGDSTLNVTDSYLAATGTSYEGLYVAVHKTYDRDPAKGDDRASAVFTNSTVISKCTDYNRGLTIRRHTGASAVLTIHGGLTVASSTEHGIYDYSGFTGEYGDAGVIIEEIYQGGRFSGRGNVCGDVSLPHEWEIGSEESIILDLCGKTVSGSPVVNGGSLILSDSVGGAEVSSSLKLAPSAFTAIGGGAYSGVIEASDGTLLTVCEAAFSSFDPTVCVDPAVAEIEENGGGNGGWSVTDLSGGLRTVTFDASGGSMADGGSVEVRWGSVLALPAAEKENCVFDGWYREKDPYSGRWNADADVVTSDLTLYAKWREIGALPDEYVPVEYLESTAGQKLSPGLKTLENVDRVVTDIRFMNLHPSNDALSTYQVPVGSGSNAGRHWGMAYDPAAKKYGFFLEGDVWLYTDDPEARVTVDFEMVGGAPADQGCRLTVGGESVWRSIAHKDADYVKGSEFTLMGVGSYTASVRLYAAQIYEDGVKTADFVPCRNVTTGEYGLYDRIGEKFWSSDSDKGFTGGSDCP